MNEGPLTPPERPKADGRLSTNIIMLARVAAACDLAIVSPVLRLVTADRWGIWID